jgi:hypothetical protein
MDDERKLTREERLALKLRENLKRRKAQSRALGSKQPYPEQPEALPKEQGDS